MCTRFFFFSKETHLSMEYGIVTDCLAVQCKKSIAQLIWLNCERSTGEISGDWRHVWVGTTTHLFKHWECDQRFLFTTCDKIILRNVLKSFKENCDTVIGGAYFMCLLFELGQFWLGLLESDLLSVICRSTRSSESCHNVDVDFFRGMSSQLTLKETGGVGWM